MNGLRLGEPSCCHHQCGRYTRLQTPPRDRSRSRNAAPSPMPGWLLPVGSRSIMQGSFPALLK